MGRPVVPSAQLTGASYPYRTTVNAAKDTNAGNDATIKLFNTDNNTTYPVQGDNTHYTTAGMIAIGAKLASYF